MKQKYLRAIMTGGSILGFVGGWMLLAHSGKPVAAIDPPPRIVAPAPVPQINAPSSLQPLPSLPQTRSMLRPRLRTGGS